MRCISNEKITMFENFLVDEEKAGATIEKYVRDITSFAEWLSGKEVTKTEVVKYKHHLTENYAPASVNSVISSLNHFFAFLEWYDLKIKALKIQRRIFAPEEKELTKAEYQKLLSAAKDKKNERLYLLMQTICSTGIRVSEIQHITVDVIKRGRAEIQAKGKCRCILLSKELCKMLKTYARERKISSGPIFVTKNGKPLDRSNIWSDMKKLCQSAGVSESKVFPHNLRHLFARTFYSIQKDVVRLADILGHSNVNTTRIYTMESGIVHRKQLQRLGLLRC